MDLAFTPEQDMLRDSVRGFLADRVPMVRVRQLMETDAGFDRAVWEEMAGMGWQGMAIPESFGGAGFTFLELGILMEEMGRALTPVPFFSSIVLGAGTVLIGGSDGQRAALLTGIATGERIAALAVVEPSGSWAESGIGTTAVGDGDNVRINGTKSYVVDGHVADTLIVAGRVENGTVGLFVVDASAPGVKAVRLETMDMTRKQAEVVLSDVVVPESDRLGAPGSGWGTIERVYDLAATALAFEQIGGGAHCLEMSVDYATVRHQFGRPIGSFQAVKHKCADMLVHLEGARSTASYAGWAAAESAEELPTAAALAKAYCSDAYFSVAAETIQVHGGIGFTWEHDAHLYFKRAKSDALMLGDAAAWRATLADRVGL
jgi:alkylation response protein AidB-like acyl-CoA dehydrogenase